jgi:hypothetical protein
VGEHDTAQIILLSQSETYFLMLTIRGTGISSMMIEHSKAQRGSGYADVACVSFG